MRRLLASMAILCLVALASGCGGEGQTSGPLESALSYVPKNTPFAVAVDTDLEGDQYKSLQGLLDRFPGGIRVEDLLADQLEGGEGVSFAKDVKPLLGNPFVVSAVDVTSFLTDGNDDFVAVLEAEDPEALDRLIEKTKPKEQGEVAGATIYDDDGTIFAVKEETIVFGASRPKLEAALERSDAGEGMDPERFADGLEGLPEEGLARLFFDVEALLAQASASDEDAENALKIEWVRALRTLGMTVSAQDSSANVDFNLKTEGELTEEDLPLAAGEEAPPVVREQGEIGFGVRDPRQIVTFFEAALQAVAPQDSGDYESAKQAISQQTGVDLEEDVFAQLTEDMSVSVALDGSFGARAEVKSPDALADTVEKVAEVLPGVSKDGELFTVEGADGGRLFFGMSNDVFVAASDEARALELGSQEPTAVEGAEGSVAMAADAEAVALRLIDQLGPELGLGGLLGGGLLSRPLEDLSGSVSTSTEGMRGSFSLTLD